MEIGDILTDREVLAIFEETGSYIKGHFLLTSGLHSDRYFEKFRILEHPHHAERMCKELAIRFGDVPVDVVIGPAIGGIIIAYEVARQFNARAIFTERVQGKMSLRRGFEIQPHEHVLIVEDLITTGGSVREVIRLVEDTKAHIQGIGLLMDRSGGTVDLGYRTDALVTTEISTFPPEECPLCKQNIPLTERGSRNILRT